MNLSYLTHKKWVLKKFGVKIIATGSPIAYRDLIQGFQRQNQLLLCSDDNYNALNISETFDFIGDPLLSGDITKKYMTHIVSSYITNLDEENRNKVIKSFYNLETTLHDTLLLEDLPLEITFDEDLKKLFKLTDVHLDKTILNSPYGIIETVLRIHQVCNLRTIPVICNVAHYIEEREWQELASLITQMKLIVILIEFTDAKNLYIRKDIPFYYIDKDLVDWY
ncbi:type II-A CRISPR-associated protein Csn2 [Lactobacillus helsingborgensis]|uniref:type II-A CRISPR-associated protein Csn2 n=1 Tax=Lactobacillus helsingborgensis TaxID=1218494 RepID=UPI00164FBEC6|nr:type II-A CRISPR-associated protein Csn2 [Lactobacillus helsingborgensis]MBC6356768.1 type II-A CRISPR-associated protein Csn2 [Lactobacillus helsingborgensis]